MPAMIVTATQPTRSYGEGEATVHALAGVELAGLGDKELGRKASERQVTYASPS